MGLPLDEIANRVLAEAGSTNDLARSLAEAGFPHGTWVSARIQTSGRGRSGRSWESEAGNLFLSYVARLPDRALWSWIPLTAAVAVASVLRTLFPPLEPRLKWPNDLLIFCQGEPAKLGGILCEAASQAGSGYVVIGIGLNCASHPEGIDRVATSLSRTLGREVTADQVRGDVIAELTSRLAELGDSGRVRIAQDFQTWTALPAGTEIDWGGGQGTVLGLGPAGELLVRSDGKERRLFAEEVRIRFPKASGESPA